MSIIRVYGLGSPFGDDQVGFRVIDHLKQCKTLQPYSSKLLEISLQDRPGARLLELMQGAKTVILIDAVKTGAKIGTLHRFQNNEIEIVNPALSSHGIHLPQLLSLGRLLYRFPTTVILYGIEIGEISLFNHVTEEIEMAANNLSKILAKKINLLVKK